MKNIIESSRLHPILDKDIIEKCSNLYPGEKNVVLPKMYEIYQKYHDVKQEIAEVRSSDMLKDFKQKLEAYLRENNPEVFHVNS